MIKNIVFDFGDVFINLDKEATISELFKLGVDEISFEMMEVAQKYEIGNLTNQEFIDEFTSMFPTVSDIDFINAWNSILKDFPKYRFDFLKSLVESKKYRIFLLSNTNDLHISWVQENWGHELFAEFKNCFEQYYLSHEINLRKPIANIYEFV
jgi:putative hydrolase of the HAD superfamily